MKYGFDLGRLKEYVERSVPLEHLPADYPTFVRFRSIGPKMELHVQQLIHDF